ncbi:HlyC/CorC family transporter [Curvibacter sp. CHRR-16]|uniref:hemolysin family protein n=1 Tax=Curvibacter sp. CHRR-16 TaxID=2835872 RepID=UPI001BD9D3BD|nr:hemolysin family protein [Curvibacter sp. CHRR-16]MBT0569007.1 HlyC/CorC family transporter [Curvibacter sp. CHRR-16]
MDFLLIVVLTLLNGVFAMSELALTASRKVRLQAMADDGDKGAATALALLDQPTQFLSTVQVGITSIGMLNGIVGEAAFSESLGNWLQHVAPLSERTADITATAIVVTIITFTTIVFGELVPKRIGQMYPEPVARLVSRPMAWVAKVARPFVRLLAMCTQAILKLLRINANAGQTVTEAEISASLEEGVDAGIIEAHEHQMVRNVFHLDDRSLTSIMRPREDIAWMDASLTVHQALDHIRHHAQKDVHSWYPVCRQSLEQVVGQVSMARLLDVQTNPGLSLEAVAEPAVFVPETLSAMELIQQFREQAARMVYVVDEYGVLQGLLTPHDVLEAITGELRPDQQEDAWATLQDDGSWLLNGTMPIGELKARLEIERELPDEERGRYNTLAGLLLAESGRMLQQGEQIVCAGWRFEVVQLQGRRVDQVRAWHDVQA